MFCINSLYEHKNKYFQPQYIEKHSVILFHILSYVFENDTNIWFIFINLDVTDYGDVYLNIKVTLHTYSSLIIIFYFLC